MEGVTMYRIIEFIFGLLFSLVFLFSPVIIAGLIESIV